VIIRAQCSVDYTRFVVSTVCLILAPVKELEAS